MPRAGLSAAVVENEAARAADEIGFDALTLAVVARRFDVAVPSLYKHVAGLPALQRRLVLRGALMVADRLDATVRGGPSDTSLADLATAYRAFAHEHPGLYRAMQRAPDAADAELAAAAQRVLAPFFAVLAVRGITGDAAIDATRAVRSAVHGFVDLEAAGGFGIPRDLDVSYAALIRVLDVGLAAV